MEKLLLPLPHAALPNSPLGSAYLCTHVYMCEGQCVSLCVYSLGREIIWKQEPSDSFFTGCLSLGAFPLECSWNGINIQC